MYIYEIKIYFFPEVKLISVGRWYVLTFFHIHFFPTILLVEFGIEDLPYRADCSLLHSWVPVSQICPPIFQGWRIFHPKINRISEAKAPRWLTTFIISPVVPRFHASSLFGRVGVKFSLEISYFGSFSLHVFAWIKMINVALSLFLQVWTHTHRKRGRFLMLECLLYLNLSRKLYWTAQTKRHKTQEMQIMPVACLLTMVGIAADLGAISQSL